MSAAHACKGMLRSGPSVRCIHRNCPGVKLRSRSVMASAAAAPADLQEKFERLQAHDKQAKRPSHAAAVRTLLANTKYGTLCTLSAASDTAGFPNGAMAPYSVDGEGLITIALSDLSQHKRCSPPVTHYQTAPGATPCLSCKALLLCPRVQVQDDCTDPCAHVNAGTFKPTAGPPWSSRKRGSAA